ncbi:MAG: hypothetical protein KDM91_18595, partial [Verrucomicrobiae bacterium]|nr:hypothetical protein [Verrucomicrobiae bacterium]
SKSSGDAGASGGKRPPTEIRRDRRRPVRPKPAGEFHPSISERRLLHEKGGFLSVGRHFVVEKPAGGYWNSGNRHNRVCLRDPTLLTL